MVYFDMLGQAHPSLFSFDCSLFIYLFFLKQLVFHVNFMNSLTASMKYLVGILIWNSLIFLKKLWSVDTLATLDLSIQGYYVS